MEDRIGETITEQELEPGVRFPMGEEGSLWRILEIDGEKQTAFVIADMPVCTKEYHKEWEDVTWEKCSLRAWLNREYLKDAFSEEEREAIIESDIVTSDNPRYRTKGGAQTRDTIFLLSLEEAEVFFENDKDRACEQGWYLRSPGCKQNRAAYVHYEGEISKDGDYVDESHGIRPAFRIDLNSIFFRSIIRRGADERIVVRLPIYFVKNGILVKVYPWAESIILPEDVKKIAKGAAEYCRKLRSIDWEASTIEIEKDAFSNCPSLKLSPKLYLTEKELDGQLARFLPDDAKAIASVLKYQKNGLRWVINALRGIGEDRICKVLGEMRKDPIDSGSLEQLSKLSGLAARKGYVSAASMLLEFHSENFTAFDPTKEYTLD